MIDSVIFKRTKVKIPKNFSFPKGISFYKDDLTGAGQFRGHVRNFWFEGYFSNSEMTFTWISGSIGVFATRKHTNNPRYEDILNGIAELEVIWKIKFTKFHIYRIDIGANFQLTFPVSGYLAILFDYPPKGKEIWASTTYFKGKSEFETLAIYDKSKQLINEFKNTRPSFCKSLLHKNILRYEIRLRTRRVNEILKRTGPLTLMEVLNEKNLTKVIRHWEASFKKIKVGIYSIAMRECSTRKEFHSMLFRVALKHLKYDNVKQFIDSTFQGEQVKRNIGVKLRADIREAMTYRVSMRASKLKKELYLEIRKARNNFLKK